MTRPESPDCESISDLLGVYALDALDQEEAALVSAHLRSCPRCAREVDEHREAVALLAAGGGPAPEMVWERIASSLEAEAAPSSGHPLPPLRLRSPRRARWAKPVRAAALAVAAAIAALVGVQTARVDQLNHRLDRLSAAVGQNRAFQGLTAALLDPSARRYTLTSTANSRPVGQLLLLPSGASYLVGSRLPGLTPGRTYQLWSMVNGRFVSVGLLGAHPGTVAFTVDPSVHPAAYLVTVEPAGGVVAPTSSPIAEATI